MILIASKQLLAKKGDGFMRLSNIKHTDLPVEDDIALHRKGWVVQRIGWVSMYAFLLAAILGLFGEGPLSKRKLQNGDVTVEFERFGRYEHAMMLRLQSKAENISTVSMPQSYIKLFRVGKIVPEPESQFISGGYVTYLFRTQGRSIINFYLDPVQRRSIDAILRVNALPFKIKQTIYP